MPKSTTQSRQNVLLTVAGGNLSPVTRSLYALSVLKGIRVDRLRIITTGAGKELLAADLPFALASMRSDYPKMFGLLSVDMNRDVIACGETRGKTVQDLATLAEQDVASDTILREIGRWTGDPKSILHTALGGGPKTFNHALTSAMQLLARAEDRLWGVLTPYEYEAAGLLYPTPKDSALGSRGDAPTPVSPGIATDSITIESKKRMPRRLSPRQARLEISELPMARMRPLFDEGTLALLNGDRLTFTALVRRAENLLLGPSLEVHVYWKSSKSVPKPRLEFRLPGERESLVTLEFDQPDSIDFVLYTYLLARRQLDETMGHSEAPRRVPIFRLETLAETLYSVQDWVLRVGSAGWRWDQDDSTVAESLQRWIISLGYGVENLDQVMTSWTALVCGAKMQRFHTLMREAFDRQAPHHEPSHYFIKNFGKATSRIERGYWFTSVPPQQIHFHPEL